MVNIASPVLIPSISMLAYAFLFYGTITDRLNEQTLSVPNQNHDSQNTEYRNKWR